VGKKRCIFFSIADVTPSGNQTDPTWSSRHRLLRIVFVVSQLRNTWLPNLSFRSAKTYHYCIYHPTPSFKSRVYGIKNILINGPIPLNLHKNDLLYSRNLHNFSGNNFVRVVNNTKTFSILWLLINIFY
jgi:hypothetical protein